MSIRFWTIESHKTLSRRQCDVCSQGRVSRRVNKSLFFPILPKSDNIMCCMLLGHTKVTKKKYVEFFLSFA